MANALKLLVVPFAALSLAACDVRQTEEGELPDVEVDAGELPEYEVTKTEEGRYPDVDVEGGNMPEYDVEMADVDVGTETKVIEVPEVTMKKKTVEVPDVDITMPDDKKDADEKKREKDDNQAYEKNWFGQGALIAPLSCQIQNPATHGCGRPPLPQDSTPKLLDLPWPLSMFNDYFLSNGTCIVSAAK